MSSPGVYSRRTRRYKNPLRHEGVRLEAESAIITRIRHIGTEYLRSVNRQALRYLIWLWISLATAKAVMGPG